MSPHILGLFAVLQKCDVGLLSIAGVGFPLPRLKRKMRIFPLLLLLQN